MTRAQQLLAEYRLNSVNAHAAALVPMLAAMLKQLNIAITQMSAIAVSGGPGSFTGLRIGFSTAKGIALGSAIPLITVPTLAALAGEAPCQNGIICPLLKSRAHEYYYAVYQRENYLDSLLQAPQLVSAENIASTLPEGALLIGHTEEICRQSGIEEKFVCAPAHFSLPTAFSIARWGYQKLMAGDILPETVEPMYLQEFIAGRKI